MCKRITIKHFSKKELLLNDLSDMKCVEEGQDKQTKTVVKLRTNRKRRHHQQNKNTTK